MRKPPLAGQRLGVPDSHPAGSVRKDRWAGAPTPTQRNTTTRPQDPPRRDSDLINDTTIDPDGHQDPTGAGLDAALAALDKSMLIAINDHLDLDGGLAQILSG